MILQLLLLLSPLANLMAENAEIVSMLAQAYMLSWAAAKAYTFILGVKAVAAGVAAAANVGLASSYAALWASMWPVIAVMGVLLIAQETGITIVEAATAALIWYTVIVGLHKLGVFAWAAAVYYLTIGIWLQNAALAVMNVLLAPITLTILAIVAAVVLVIGVFIYWEEILYGLGVAIEYILELLAKLANTLSFGLLDIGGTGTLFDGWGNIDIFHSGGMSHGGLAMLEAGETVKSAAAVSEEERQSYTRGGGNTNNINVSGVVDPVAAAGEVVRKLNRQNRLGMGSESW